MHIQTIAPKASSQIIRRRVESLMTDLLDIGFGIKLHSDPEAFASFYRQVEGCDPASPLDPAYCHLDAGNFFWVQVLDAHRHIIAMCAGRLISAPAESGGLAALLRNQTIFGDRAAHLWAPEIEIAGAASELYGRLGYVGGGWVMPKRLPRTLDRNDKGHPGWRGRGLIGFCVQLVHAHLLERFQVDHLIGFVRPHHRELALSAIGYNFHREAELSGRYFTGTGYAEPLWFVYSTREDAIEDLSGNIRPVFRKEGIIEISTVKNSRPKRKVS